MRGKYSGRQSPRSENKIQRSKALLTIRSRTIKDFARLGLELAVFVVEGLAPPAAPHQHKPTACFRRTDILVGFGGSYLCAACTFGQAISTAELGEYGWQPSRPFPQWPFALLRELLDCEP
jgi:hypothetical protein